MFVLFRRHGRFVILTLALLLVVGCGPKVKVTVDTKDDAVESSIAEDVSTAAGTESKVEAATEDSMPTEETTSIEAGSQSTPDEDATAVTLVRETVTLGDPSLTAGIPGDGDLTVEAIDAWLSDPAKHVSLDIQLPFSLAGAKDMIKGLDDNPMTRAKIELGRQLYFDTRLSSDNTISCASCHHPEDGYGRKTQFGVGVADQEGNRNSPVAFNRIITDLQFWDGRAGSLEEQAKGPVANPIEMGNTHEACIATVSSIDGYVKQFEMVFPNEGLNIDTIAKAIATFERALVTGPAPYDHLEIVKAVQSQYGEDEIAEDLKEEDPELYEKYTLSKAIVDEKMSASAIRGAELFFSEKANCTACHTGANFTDEMYHNLGVGMEAAEPDLGRYEITKEEKDKCFQNANRSKRCHDSSFYARRQSADAGRSR